MTLSKLRSNPLPWTGTLIALALAIAASPPRAYAAPPAAKAGASASLRAEQATLTRAGARLAIGAVIERAAQLNAGAAVAIVDAGGNLMALERVDATFAAGALISYGKARTAALFKRPTSVFEQIIRDGRTPMVALNDFTPLQGGVPIAVRGEILGAVGVSGANNAQQDEELAVAGANAVIAALGGEAIAVAVPASSPAAAVAAPVKTGAGQSAAKAASPEVRYFPGTDVDAAFAHGAPLIESDQYKVHASRREGPGQAEVHEQDTDILRVLTGHATIVTGGTVVGAKTIAAGEIRGTSIAGGSPHVLSPGDVMIVPAGVPHWFRDVDGPLTYYVVKTH